MRGVRLCGPDDTKYVSARKSSQVLLAPSARYQLVEQCAHLRRISKIRDHEAVHTVEVGPDTDVVHARNPGDVLDLVRDLGDGDLRLRVSGIPGGHSAVDRLAVVVELR